MKGPQTDKWAENENGAAKMTTTTIPNHYAEGWRLNRLMDLSHMYNSREKAGETCWETYEFYEIMRDQNDFFSEAIEEWIDFDLFSNWVTGSWAESTAEEREEVATKESIEEAHKLWIEFEANRLVFWNKLSEFEQFIFWDDYICFR
tara:strand:- start:277 stop:717 length:441 start_codon:yes stop_codon:yes gene_type:complete